MYQKCGGLGSFGIDNKAILESEYRNCAGFNTWSQHTPKIQGAIFTEKLSGTRKLREKVPREGSVNLNFHEQEWSLR